MFEAKCSSCRKTAQVPFKPSPDKPVYCQECFSERKANRRETYSNSKNAVVVGKEGWAKRRDSGETTKKKHGTSIKFVSAV
jgi:CxxC-x17-CxxC domain-containing protein